MWQKIQIYEQREYRVDRLHEAKDKNHYAVVLNQAPSDNLVKVFSDSSPLTNKYDYSFTILEIRIALRTSRSNTAPGSDGIPTRVLQLCGLEEDVLNVLNSHSILSNNDNIVPDKWKHSIIVSIPKKGYSSSLENQRGIAKSCAFAKLTNKPLLARIRDIIEPQLLGVHSGFRDGRSTVEQTMALRCILDMCRVSKRMTTIIFVDFSKTCDSIDRRAISIVLSKYGVSELLIANVMQFYIGTSAVVATAHGNTEKFSTTSGVLQGDSLAPFLFITLFDYVLRETLLDNIDGFTISLRRSSRSGIRYIQVYAPTSVSSQEELEEFYDDLQTEMRHKKTHYNVIMGDFNAKVGKGDEDCVGSFGYGVRNDRDDDLIKKNGSWAHFPVGRESRCNLSIQIESSKATTCRLHPSVLQDQTPSVSPAELLLSRETRRTLAQLRTNKSPLLVSYLFSIGDPRHPSPLCPLCLMHDHTSSHLFECKSLPTSLSSLDLWTNPDKVEPFLATWGERLLAAT